MTKDQEISLLKYVIKNSFWMARRYAHGRNTYAPGMVREAYLILKRSFPDAVPEIDPTIEPPSELRKGFDLRTDYLDDTNV